MSTKDQIKAALRESTTYMGMDLVPVKDFKPLMWKLISELEAYEKAIAEIGQATEWPEVGNALRALDESLRAI